MERQVSVVKENRSDHVTAAAASSEEHRRFDLCKIEPNLNLQIIVMTERDACGEAILCNVKGRKEFSWKALEHCCGQLCYKEPPLIGSREVRPDDIEGLPAECLTSTKCWQCHSCNNDGSGFFRSQDLGDGLLPVTKPVTKLVMAA